MTERFLKLILSAELDYLQENHPNAFLLLILIAKRARRYDGNPDELVIGEAYIGDYEKAGIATRQQYRTALDVLTMRSHIIKVETCRTRQKSTTGSTTKGTKVKILRSDVCDINPEYNNHLINHRATTDQPPTNHEQERTRKNKKEKKEQQPPVDVLSCLIPLQIPEKEKQRISRQNQLQEKVVIDAVNVVTQSTFEHEESLLKSLNAAIKGKWKLRQASNDIVENKTISKRLENVDHPYKFIAAIEGLEIIIGSQTRFIPYKKSAESFLTDLEEIGRVNIGALT